MIDTSIAPTVRETTVEGANGTPLRVRIVSPPGAIRAEVIITHGMGEHCRRYDHVAAALGAHGLRVWCYDLRGHGRSPGTRGDAEKYEFFLHDLERILEAAQQDGREIFLFGHSFGGQVTARFVEKRQPRVRGVVILSPWFELAFRPAWWRIALAHLGMLIGPAKPHATPASPARLSRDLPHLLAMPDLDLVHRKLTPRLFFAIGAQGRLALQQAELFKPPLLLIHGDADSVTCHRATERFFDRCSSTDKVLHLEKGAFHETHNDLCRDQVITRITNWLEERL